MAEQNTTGLGATKCLTTYDEDEQEEGAVLRLVLEHHPATFTQVELNRQLTGGGSRTFSEFDAIERAMRELAGSGLLHRPGEDEMVRPTRAAVRSFELIGDR
jgi:hypothetical protein